jgi:hypothetical protein
MLEVILRDGERRELARVAEPGNTGYLAQPEGRYLSELSEHSFDTFAREDMTGLIDELLAVRSSRTDARELAHVDAVIDLARRAQALDRATLTFAPATRHS